MIGHPTRRAEAYLYVAIFALGFTVATLVIAIGKIEAAVAWEQDRRRKLLDELEEAERRADQHGRRFEAPADGPAKVLDLDVDELEKP